jgi:hypothetical protein
MSRSKYRPDINLSSSPRWFRNIFTTRRQRQEARLAVRLFVKGADADAFVLTSDSRRRPYYW